MSTQVASSWFGISRQAYYQAQQRQRQEQAEEALLLDLVQALRQRHPRLGVRKLYHELQAPMAKLGIARGRDALFTLLRTHDLLVPVKRRASRTTYPGLGRCPNLLDGLTITRVNQVWVADITYLTTEQGFRYLALLTDAYARFIVGYDLSSSLAVDGSLRALQQATSRLPSSQLQGLIHHSDHGVQYSAWPYWQHLLHCGIRPSMGQVGNCYENPLAERINGILKGEYGLDALFVDDPHAATAVAQAIHLYNYERPHFALGLAKPAQLYCPP